MHHVGATQIQIGRIRQNMLMQIFSIRFSHGPIGLYARTPSRIGLLLSTSYDIPMMPAVKALLVVTLEVDGWRCFRSCSDCCCWHFPSCCQHHCWRECCWRWKPDMGSK